MNNLVKLEDGKLVVSSREVAINFEKEHKNILRDIDNIMSEGVAQNWADLFYETTYTHPQNKQEYKEILMNRDGFTLLAMGFTGQKALQWKLKYIEAFNKMEKSLQDNMNLGNLSPQLQLLINMELKQKELETTLTETKEEIQAIRDVIVINPGAEWRKETNKILNAIGKKLDDYQTPRHEAYEALKERANCRPSVLVNNLKKRASENGMAKSKVDNLGILDVLENEPRLREIYVTIVKQMAVKYKIA